MFNKRFVTSETADMAYLYFNEWRWMYHPVWRINIEDMRF